MAPQPLREIETPDFAERAQGARTDSAAARSEKEACQKMPAGEQAAAAVPSGARRTSAIFDSSYEQRVFERPSHPDPPVAAHERGRLGPFRVRHARVHNGNPTA